MDSGLGLGSKNDSKTDPKLVQKLSKNLVIFCTVFFAILAPFWNSKAAEKEPKLALEGGPGEVSEGQDAFLRTCIWTRFL